MEILAEIYRCDGINVKGKTVYRTAVRAVVLRDTSLLMIYSSNVGDYKFPGGGVNQGETHLQALRREVQEECGMSVMNVGLEVGAVIEYNVPMEDNYDVFKMISHYYQCEVKDEVGTQKLDEYEQNLGFKPIWIEIDDAIRFNKALLRSEKNIEWLKREIFVLEYLQKNIIVPDA